MACRIPETAAGQAPDHLSGQRWEAAGSVPLEGRSEHERSEGIAGKREGSAVKGGGGIGSRIAGWCADKFFLFVVIGAIMIAVVGASKTATISNTATVYAGTSGGIALGNIPAFFSSLATGQALVEKANGAPPKGETSGDLTGTPKCKKGEKLDARTGVCV